MGLRKIWKIKNNKKKNRPQSVYHIYQPLRSGRIWHKVIFKQRLTGLNSEFSFSLTSCLTKAEEPSLPYYLPIAGGRIIGFIPFSRVLVLCEMQSVSSRIWTRVTVSISYDDNHYTTGTSNQFTDLKSNKFHCYYKTTPAGLVWTEEWYTHFSSSLISSLPFSLSLLTWAFQPYIYIYIYTLNHMLISYVKQECYVIWRGEHNVSSS